MSPARAALLFLGAASLALGARLWALSEAPGVPFWYDEVWTAQLATFPTSLSALVQRAAREDYHPPLGYLAYRAYAALLGLRDGGGARPPEGLEDRLRLLPALAASAGAGLLALALLWSTGSPAASLLGALAFALAPAGLTVGLEARQYGLLLLFLPLALLGGASRSYPLYFLGALLASWTHYLALPYALAFGLAFPPWKVLLPFLPLALWTGAFLGQAARAGDLLLARPETAWASALAWGDVPEGAYLLPGLLLWASLLPALALREGQRSLLPFLLLALSSLALGANLFSHRYLPLALPSLAYALGLAFPRLPRACRLLPLAALLSWTLLLPWIPQARALQGSMGYLALVASSLPYREVRAANEAAGFTAAYYARDKEVALLVPGPGLERALLLVPADLPPPPELRPALSRRRGFVYGGWALLLPRSEGGGAYHGERR